MQVPRRVPLRPASCRPLGEPLFVPLSRCIHSISPALSLGTSPRCICRPAMRQELAAERLHTEQNNYLHSSLQEGRSHDTRPSPSQQRRLQREQAIYQHCPPVPRFRKSQRNRKKQKKVSHLFGRLSSRRLQSHTPRTSFLFSIASDLVRIPRLGVVATFSSHQAAGPSPSGVNPTSPLLTLTDSHPSHPHRQAPPGNCAELQPHPSTASRWALSPRKPTQNHFLLLIPGNSRLPLCSPSLKAHF